LPNLCENNIYPIKSLLHLPSLYYPIIKINKGEVIDDIPIEFKSGEHKIRKKEERKTAQSGNFGPLVDLYFCCYIE